MPTRYHLGFAVSNYFEYGGMQRTMIRIARECQFQGHTVDIFSTRWQGELLNDVNVKMIKSLAITNHGKTQALANHLRKVQALNHYDCIVGFNALSCLDVYYAATPCLAARLEKTKSKFVRLLPRYRTYLRHEANVFGRNLKTEIILIAHLEREKFIEYYGTEKERFHLLPPGINRTLFLQRIPEPQERVAIRVKMGVSTDEYLLLAVGSGFKTKGVDRSIRAVSSLPSELKNRCKLVVVGRGKFMPYLALAKKLGVSNNVRFIGVRDDVVDLYYSADLLIHPAYTENTGTILIEAMLCGLPVLATANCGFAFHVSSAKAGLICPEPFNQIKLNDQLLMMLTSDKRKTWAMNGQTYCRHTDLYSLIGKATDVIIARAEKNRKNKL